MDLTSPATATFGIWTIARFAALAVLATEALFLSTSRGHDRRAEGAHRVPSEGRAEGAHRVPISLDFSRLFWALTPAVILVGLCFWCTNFVSADRSATGPGAQVARLGP